MGYASGQARLMFLTASISDIDNRMMLLSNRLQVLAAVGSSIFRSNFDMMNGKIDPARVNTAQYEAQREYLHLIERPIDMEMKELQTQRQAKEAELKNVEEMVKKEAEKAAPKFA